MLARDGAGTQSPVHPRNPPVGYPAVLAAGEGGRLKKGDFVRVLPEGLQGIAVAVDVLRIQVAIAWPRRSEPETRLFVFPRQYVVSEVSLRSLGRNGPSEGAGGRAERGNQGG